METYSDNDYTEKSGWDNTPMQPPRRPLAQPTPMDYLNNPVGASALSPQEPFSMVPQQSMFAPPTPPEMEAPHAPPTNTITTSHMAPESPLDRALGRWDSDRGALAELTKKGPDQFKPSIWRKLAGVALGTGAGMVSQRQGYGRYSIAGGNPEEAGKVARDFVYGPQASRNADYQRRLTAAKETADTSFQDYALMRQQNEDSLRAQNVQSEIDYRNRPQILQSEEGGYYRIPQVSGSATPITVDPRVAATMPEGTGPGQSSQLPQVLVGPTKPTPQDQTAITDLDVNGQNNKVVVDKNTGKYKVVGPSKLPTVNPAANDNRVDRSYQFHTKQFETIGKPLQDRMDRINRLQISLNQNNPQADSLIAPELLTAMAGGQGSGLRMNEAEIARIVGGKNNWQKMKSQLMAWQTDPNKPFQFLPEQRGQVQALMNAMAERVRGKVDLLNQAQQRLADATDPAIHKQLLAEVKKRISVIDNIEDAVAKDSAGRTVYKSGGKYVYNDGSEYTPQQKQP